MNSKYKIPLLLAVSAVMTGLSVTFPAVFDILEWVSMIPFVFAVLSVADGDMRLRRVYLLGLLYFELFYMVGFHFFLYLYPLDFTGLGPVSSVLVIAVAWLGLPFLQAIFGALALVIITLCMRSSFAKRFPLLKPFFIPVGYAAYEFTQTLGWWGVPWSRLPLGQTELLFPIHLSSILGSYFVTFLIVLVNTLLCLAIKNRGEIKRVKLAALSALAVFTLNFALGAAVFAVRTSEAKNAEKISVGVVQANFDSTEKWFGDPTLILDAHVEYTKRCAEDGADIVVWPETSLPFMISEGDFYSETICATAKDYGIYVLVGCMQYVDDESFNSVLCFTPDGELSPTVYYKRHLVPFGEYVPMRPVIDAVLPFLSELSMLSDDMTPGDEPRLFETDFGKVGSLICFDSIYETLAIDSVRDGARLLALSTNDSWFSDSAGIYMHNSQAVLRAVELGRSVARGANTGVSSIISSTGEVLLEIAPLTEGYAVAEVPLMDNLTPYACIGNLFVYILFALCLSPIVYKCVLFIKRRRGSTAID